MFGLFKKKTLLDNETTEWLFETFAWALGNFGTDIFYQDTILVTPTNNHFPDETDDIDEKASMIFEKVKVYAGMEDWKCKLEAQKSDGNPLVAPTIAVQNSPQSPAGTFSVQGDDEQIIVITYNPSQVANPEMLIATYAHELGHYLSAIAKEPPPGGNELWEPATDLLASFMGFGLFLTNSAFSFSQYSDFNSQGWSSQSQGYLSQYELTYILAIFCILKEIQNSEVERHLKSSLRPFYRNSVKEILTKTEQLSRLKEIEYVTKINKNI